MWKKIPENILHDINVLNEYTATHDKESTLTTCSTRNKIFTANAGGGDDGSVESLSCDSRFGDTKRVGDVHTHPYNPTAVGLLPSQADLAVTLSESKAHNNKQVSCISNKQSPLVVCHQPKRVPDQSKINQYIDHEIDSGEFYKSEFHRKNFRRDFSVAYFDPATGNRVEPSDDQIVQTMFGASIPVIQEENNKRDQDKLCKYVNTLSGSKKSITKKCKNTLSGRTSATS